MRIFLIRLLIAASALLMLPQRAAFADEDKAKAVKLLAAGDRNLASGDRFSKARRTRKKATAAYKRALAKYEKAHETFASPKIYFPIALTQQRLHLYLESHKNYHLFLTESEAPAEELVEGAKEGIQAVRTHLAGLDLTVPNGATVKIDGEPIELGEEPNYFEPGEHLVLVELKEHKSYSEEITLEKAEVTSHTVELEKEKAVAVEVEKPKTVVVKKKKGGPSKLPMQLSFGTAGALVLGATFTVVLASKKKSRSEDETLSDSTRDKAKKRSDTYFLVSGALLGGAVLATGYGLIHYYTSYRPAKRKHDKSAFQVVPTANDEGLGFAVVGRF